MELPWCYYMGRRTEGKSHAKTSKITGPDRTTDFIIPECQIRMHVSKINIGDQYHSKITWILTHSLLQPILAQDNRKKRQLKNISVKMTCTKEQN